MLSSQVQAEPKALPQRATLLRYGTLRILDLGKKGPFVASVFVPFFGPSKRKRKKERKKQRKKKRERKRK